MTGPHPGATALTLAVLAVGTLTGCGSPRPVGGPATVDMITDSGGYPARRQLIDRATERATSTCMAAAGFAWSGFAGEPGPGPGNRARDGYGITAPAVPPPGNATGGPELAALIGSPPRRATLRLPGLAQYTFPDSGCLAEGRAAVAGDTTAWARLAYLPGELNKQLSQRVAGDPRLVAARAAWSGCMAGHGHRYAAPDDIPAALAGRLRAHPEQRAALHAEETALAGLDARCNQRTRLSRTELDLRRAAVPGLGAARLEQAGELTGLAEAATVRARKILTR
ncbi:hypothetical protein [Symbioplanes lichenis]|uniref:hypothetical protein n=1 Tax=Symbioplanes lichenis TaxID=1629072 RepID=UPI0027393CF3|nr:hypothetical protein [Actinoplanes lichenis]